MAATSDHNLLTMFVYICKKPLDGHGRKVIHSGDSDHNLLTMFVYICKKPLDGHGRKVIHSGDIRPLPSHYIGIDS